MKVNDYKVEIDEKGLGRLNVLVAGEWTEVSDIGVVSGMSADAASERAKSYLKAYDYEIVPVMKEKEDGELLPDASMSDQLSDLAFVRLQMKKIIKKLADKNVPVSEKKSMLPIFQTMCASAQIMANTCKLEMSIRKITAIDVD